MRRRPGGVARADALPRDTSETPPRHFLGSGERLSQAAAAHASRIKCLVSTFRSCGGGGAHLSSASTDGSIRLWRLVAAGAGRLVIDQHWYLNWASPPGSPLGWEEMHRRACSEAAQTWRPYVAAGLPLILGEWSLATNPDEHVDMVQKAEALCLLRRAVARRARSAARSPSRAARGCSGAGGWSSSRRPPRSRKSGQLCTRTCQLARR